MLIFVPVLLAAAAAGTHNAELTSLVDLAGAAPPEFAAATLVRVARAVQPEDPAWAADLYASAFELGSAASDALPKRALINSAPVYAYKIDRLSLQAAAVRGLLARDPTRARELFTRMSPPRIAAGKCEDSLVDDPADYYALVAEIANAAYSVKQRAREEHLAPAYLAIQSITSPVEIAPAARMIRALRLTSAQFDVLTAKLGSALERVAGDDRAFSATLRDVESALAGMPALGLELVDYKARNQNNKQCADDRIATGGIAGAASPSASEDPELERWKKDFFALAFGRGDRALTDKEKNTSEWRDRLHDLLRRVDEWRPVGGASQAATASAKADVLSGAVWITPPGPDRDRVLDAFIAYLSQAAAEAENRSAWFARVEGLLRLTRATHPEQEVNLLAAYERSGNPILTLYARLERALPSKISGN